VYGVSFSAANFLANSSETMAFFSAMKFSAFLYMEHRSRIRGKLPPPFRRAQT
jgi:hypothetical protein